MRRNALSKYPLISETIVFIRQNLSLIGISSFLVLNWGNTFQALKFSILCLAYFQMSEISRLEKYPNLLSEHNIEALVTTLLLAFLIVVINLNLTSLIDPFGLRQSLMTRELRHLRKSVSQKKKMLKEQDSYLSALIQERQLNKELCTVLLRMEDIVQRYELNSKALNPDTPKRAKLSEIDPSFQDLFDFTESENGSKKTPRPS